MAWKVGETFHYCNFNLLRPEFQHSLESLRAFMPRFLSLFHDKETIFIMESTCGSSQQNLINEYDITSTPVASCIVVMAGSMLSLRIIASERILLFCISMPDRP